LLNLERKKITKMFLLNFDPYFHLKNVGKKISVILTEDVLTLAPWAWAKA